MLYEYPNGEIQQLEQEDIAEQLQRLAALRKAAPPVAVPNYPLRDMNEDLTLLDLFGEKTTLFAIHNVGQGCRYCTPRVVLAQPGNMSAKDFNKCRPQTPAYLACADWKPRDGGLLA